ncbi:hypothetical protein FN846DRAFT_504593 [Sphaerosporella brunnea]|uniref:Uncharacterized protein n=1 Tax=Sphaerosporella brunnea TaxID=1250544 RepID=A0A5J5EEK5_9PEZI|nr:hypothetical protein FN846DRAFT_504593 [Sphaerosporella brunnea]
MHMRFPPCPYLVAGLSSAFNILHTEESPGAIARLRPVLGRSWMPAWLALPCDIFMSIFMRKSSPYKTTRYLLRARAELYRVSGYIGNFFFFFFFFCRSHIGGKREEKLRTSTH